MTPQSLLLFMQGKILLIILMYLVSQLTAVFNHLFASYYSQSVRFTYWRGSKDHEVDLVAEIGEQIIPFGIKYRAQHTGKRDLKGLLELCKKKSIEDT